MESGCFNFETSSDSDSPAFSEKQKTQKATAKTIQECIARLQHKGYPLYEIEKIVDSTTEVESLVFISKIISPYYEGQYEFEKAK